MAYTRRNYTPFQYTPQSYQPAQDQLPYGQNFQPFDYEQMFKPEPPPPTPAPQPDFVKQYEDITRNRPNRLAYQEAVTKGPETIERSKWAKLAAALAAGGTYLGTGDPVAGARLGTSVYQAPNVRAQERHAERVRGLGNLAQFEDSDIANKVRALEMQRGEFWKGKEDARQDEQLRLQRQTTEAQLQNWKEDNERQNWVTRTDPNTGIAMHHNVKTGVERPIGKVALTSQEALEKEIQKVIQTEIAKSPFEQATEARQNAQRMREIGAQGANSLAVAREGTQSREKIASDKLAADKDKVANKLRTDAAKRKPGDIYGMTQIDLAEAVTAGLLPPEAANYLKQNEAGTPIVEYPFMFGSDPELEAKVNAFVSQSLAKNKGGGGATPATAGRGGPAPAKEMVKEQRSKTNPNETLIVYSYDGGVTWSPERRK